MSVFEHPALEVTQFVGKGRGFRATDRIPAGTVILQEKPWQNSNVGSPAPGVLSPSTKESVVSFILHSPSASALSYTPSAYRHEKSSINGVSDLAYSEAAAKARTNMFLTDGGFIVLFDRLSIFNHECSPNSCYHQQFVSTGPTTAAGTEATVVGTIMTIRDVDPGEELTIAYNPQALMVLRELRKEFLKNTHGFPCSCRRCTEPMGISTPDGILTRMSPSFEALSQKEQDDVQLEVMLAHKELVEVTENEHGLVQALDVRHLPARQLIQVTNKFMHLAKQHLHVAHWQRHQIRRERIKAYLALAQYLPALSLMLEAMEAEALVLPEHFVLKDRYHVLFHKTLAKAQLPGRIHDELLAKLDPARVSSSQHPLMISSILRMKEWLAVIKFPHPNSGPSKSLPITDSGAPPREHKLPEPKQKASKPSQKQPPEQRQKSEATRPQENMTAKSTGAVIKAPVVDPATTNSSLKSSGSPANSNLKSAGSPTNSSLKSAGSQASGLLHTLKQNEAGDGGVLQVDLPSNITSVKDLDLEVEPREVHISFNHSSYELQDLASGAETANSQHECSKAGERRVAYTIRVPLHLPAICAEQAHAKFSKRRGQLQIWWGTY
ncbi:hypothetical protein CYMTET_24791 [Cymbomonas tetramitiformis]|uniref:SET domain-containing protein n=1 Tax=Cymbomonas tetramitiformis TaxID=36881 RepID=A0AAE0FVX6_9CHLO|nr:hypothetical protein CYMTET_24791 [Cymbomonas tetramitiformis]